MDSMSIVGVEPKACRQFECIFSLINTEYHPCLCNFQDKMRAVANLCFATASFVSELCHCEEAEGRCGNLLLKVGIPTPACELAWNDTVFYTYSFFFVCQVSPLG